MTVTNMMEQQLKLLKQLDELIDMSERNGTSVPKPEIDSLRTYVDTMKQACNTALLLARSSVQTSKPEEKAKSAKEESEESATPAEPEKLKKPRSSKKKNEEPPADDPPQDDDDDLDFLD